MATERRGTANAGSGSGTSAVPNVTGIAGITSGDLMLAMAMTGANKTVSIGIADAGAAWGIEVTVYNGTTDETMFLASKTYNAGDGNPTISWTGSEVWGASVLVGYSDIAAVLSLVIAGPLDDYSFGDGTLPFPEVANTAADVAQSLAPRLALPSHRELQRAACIPRPGSKPARGLRRGQRTTCHA